MVLLKDISSCSYSFFINCIVSTLIDQNYLQYLCEFNSSHALHLMVVTFKHRALKHLNWHKLLHVTQLTQILECEKANKSDIVFEQYLKYIAGKQIT